MNIIFRRHHICIIKTRGVCSQEITFEVQDNKLTNVRFIGGCSGNTQGVARLVEGMEVDEAIRRLDGIQCGPRPTSCPDQLARALKQFKDVKEGEGTQKALEMRGFWVPFLNFSYSIRMPSVTGPKPSIAPSLIATKVPLKR